MRLSLELIVIAIVILVVALVILTLFGGGISRFQTGWGGVSEDQLKYNQCNMLCTQACFGLSENANPEDWGEYKYVTSKGTKVECGGTCTCTKSGGKWTP